MAGSRGESPESVTHSMGLTSPPLELRIEDTGPISKVVLDEANRIIHADRHEQYGTAEESFSRIADLWTAYLDRPISAHDVAMMMVLLKVSRAKTDQRMDTTVDIAGYAALAQRMVKLLPAKG